jgi:hypothetical protein
MIPMKARSTVVFFILLFLSTTHAQTNDGTPTNSALGMNLYLPSFEARLSIGFNYDLLRSLTDVSFDNSKGYFGFNVPLEQTLNLKSMSPMVPAFDNILSDTTIIKNGNDFKAKAGARQNPNITVRVDVPMMGGVASFSNVQNFYMNFQTILGNPNLFLNYDTSGINFLLRGTVNVPLDLTMSWETMTFAYAFNVNKWAMFALALNRHVFSVDLRGKVDADLLGRYSVDVSQAGGAGGVSIPPIEGTLNYPSERIHGQIYGYYDADVWSPSLAMKLWRFSLDARFGIKTRAKGELSATYALPFFLDPETFQSSVDFGKTSSFNDPNIRIGLQTNATDSLSYTTEKTSGGKTRQSDLEWSMPTGITLGFDIIRDHLSISYTKLYGDLGLKLDHISKVTSSLNGDTVSGSKNDSMVLDMGFSIDHIMTMRISVYTAYLNLGAFAMDMRSAGHSNMLGSKMPSQIKLGNAALLPILNMGTLLGTRWQVLLDLNILPVPALRSGLVYNF